MGRTNKKIPSSVQGKAVRVPVIMQMDDLEEGGWQGLKNKKERLKAWDYYCYNIACKNNDKKTIVAIERKFHTGFFDALFLPSEYMHKNTQC